MSKDIREVLEGLQFQGENESVVYAIDSEPWGGSPSTIVHDVFDEEDLIVSLKATLMSGSSSVTSHIITLPALSGLTFRTLYKVTVKFTSGGNILEGYFRVKGER